MHQGESGGIPNFIDKMPVAVHPFFRHFDVSALGRKSSQGKPEGICAVLIDNAQGIDHIALRFTHLLAGLVTHQGVHIDVFERYILHKMDAHHHHARHPEEQNVETGDQHRGGVKGFQKRRFFRPAHG